jgi:hypothetical protein
LRPKTKQGWHGMKTIETGSCTALVPVEQPGMTQKQLFTRSRPDAPFVTQLIATAVGETQTRLLRRATPADALKDYGCAAARRVEPLRPNGARISLVA